MDDVNQSAGDCAVLAGATPTGTTSSGAHAPSSAPVRRERNGSNTLAELIGEYMAQYAGRDTTRAQRLRWWAVQLGDVRLADFDDDRAYYAMEDLAAQSGRYWAGTDADGRVIYKAKKKPLAPATVNRYSAAMASVCTWAVKKRIAPPGWQSPFRRIERKVENNEIVRFLSDAEREALLSVPESHFDRSCYTFPLTLTV